MGNINPKELSEIRKNKMNESGMRLLNLHKKRLVKRADEMRDGGKVRVYSVS